MADVTINGAEIYTEADLHRSLEVQLEFGEYYGRNLAALRDRLLADVPRPVRLVWEHSDISRARLGDDLFDKVRAVLEEVVEQDVEFGWEDRFEYHLA
ncbi:barstar family protein [Nocardioides sp. R1-1]|uniref:barstar family protein n=1 Tax=Nocardioides sp. R1-1 TaxID=3383502 RepID=UPI0038D12B59